MILASRVLAFSRSFLLPSSATLKEIYFLNLLKQAPDLLTPLVGSSDSAMQAYAKHLHANAIERVFCHNSFSKQSKKVKKKE